MDAYDTKIAEIASKHLGRTSDGKLMKRYEQPDKHDPSLLVGIPRIINREKYDIETQPVGYEAWHAYEFSYLNANGAPQTGILKISYSAHSPNMVESKSLKLYLNSFDNEKFEFYQDAVDIIRGDLFNTIGTEVNVAIHFDDFYHTWELASPLQIAFDQMDYFGVDIKEYEENVNLLFENVTRHDDPNSDPVTMHTANLRSHCEITNQKDTGNCYIALAGKETPNRESLYKYVISLRNSQHFHENITEIMYDVLWKNFDLDYLFVANLYNRRGGIDIHSVRANSKEVLEYHIGEYDNPFMLFSKTFQQ
jgi:7-cyano-7-deazaguanine reductase